MEPNWNVIVSVVGNVDRLGAEIVRLVETVPPEDDLFGRREWARRYNATVDRYAAAVDAAKLITKGGF